MTKNITLLFLTLGSSLFGGWHEWSADYGSKHEWERAKEISAQKAFREKQKQIALQKTIFKTFLLCLKETPSEIPFDIVKEIMTEVVLPNDIKKLLPELENMRGIKNNR